jgi:hypothetical protein
MKTTCASLALRRASSPQPVRQFRGSGRAAPRIFSDPTLGLRQPAKCPKCGGSDLRFILYGYPNIEALAMIVRGVACLGFSSIDRWLPDWRCYNCGHEWFDADDPAKQKLERLVERVLGPEDDHQPLAA